VLEALARLVADLSEPGAALVDLSLADLSVAARDLADPSLAGPSSANASPADPSSANASPAGPSLADLVMGLGLTYVAVRDELEDPGALGQHLETRLAGRPVAAVCIGDALNRVGRLDSYLAGLRALCDRLGNAPLVLASPNVTHFDIAAKLLMGRWDVSRAGMLATAYRRHFSGHSLAETMTAHRWRERGADDVNSEVSDQHFPKEAAPLERSTPLGALLCDVRESAAPGAHVAWLVRAYAASDEPGSGAGTHDPSATRPFLSVLVRTQGRREVTLQEALLCLAAQTCDDFEVLVVLHNADTLSAASVRCLVSSFHDSFSSRVRVVEASGGGRCRPLNVGAADARGRYVAMLDDDDLVLANWVETFRSAATRHPGRVVRSAVATQRTVLRRGAWGGRDGYEVVDRPRLVFALDFDHVDHILDNRTPNNGYAFPRSLFSDLGIRWDESLPVLEDWDQLLRAASTCGVTSVPTITGLLRWWDQGEDSKSQHTPALWEATRRRVIEKHDSVPLLFDRGTFSRLRTRLIDGDVAHAYATRLEGEVARLSRELEAAQADLASAEHDRGAMAADRAAALAALEAIRSSRSWQLTAGIRRGTAMARRVARRVSRLGSRLRRSSPVRRAARR
jgi:hypothetical protein